MTENEQLLEVANRVVLAIHNMKDVYNKGEEPSREECVLCLGAVFVVGDELEEACRSAIASRN